MEGPLKHPFTYDQTDTFGNAREEEETPNIESDRGECSG